MQRTYIYILSLLAMAISGCTADVPFVWTEPETPSNTVTEFVTDFDTTIRDYDGTTATDAANDVVGSDKSFYWEANKFSNKINVIFSGNTANVETSISGLVTDINGAYVTLDMGTNEVKNIEIVVQGQTDNGALKIYGKNKFKLTLNGAQITSKRGPAINDQCKKRVFLHLNAGTTNELKDQTEYTAETYYAEGSNFETEDAKGCLFSEGNVILSGTGALVIDANHRHGLATDGYLWMRPGVTLAVTNAAKNAIHAKGNANDNIGIVINGGYIYANVAADGGKCLKSDNNIIINGGTLNLNTSGTSYYDVEENDTSSSTCIKSDLSTAIHGGAIVMKSTGEGAKGINADNSIYVTAGELCSYSLGRNFAADTSIEISGGKVYAFSLNDYALYSPTISVTDGYVIGINTNTRLSVPKQNAYIDGGYVAAYGFNALTEPSAASKQSYVKSDGATMQSGLSAAVVSDGKCVIGYTADFTEPELLPLLLSSPELVGSKQYTLQLNATIANPTSEWQGLILGGTQTSN